MRYLCVFSLFHFRGTRGFQWEIHNENISIGKVKRMDNWNESFVRSDAQTSWMGIKGEEFPLGLKVIKNLKLTLIFYFLSLWILFLFLLGWGKILLFKKALTWSACRWLSCLRLNLLSRIGLNLQFVTSDWVDRLQRGQSPSCARSVCSKTSCW